jgi:hypothetical protein
MPGGSNPTKAERLAEFLRRLAAAPPAADFDEAYRQICDILNAVEDDMTNIPYDPSKWMVDGRLYPPQADHMKLMPGRSDVKRFRSRANATLIGDNGAIRIEDLSGRTILDKPGGDRRTI